MYRALIVVLVLAACASASRSQRCAPIDPELFADYGGLYDECTVEQRARLTFAPRIDYPYAAPRNVTCLIGTLKFVVDTLGHVLPETAQVAAGNDQRYVELMLNYLPQLRFAPGKVKGRSVHQVSRWESRTAARLPVSMGRVDPAQRASC